MRRCSCGSSSSGRCRKIPTGLIWILSALVIVVFIAMFANAAEEREPWKIPSFKAR